MFLSFFKPEKRHLRETKVTAHVDQQFFSLKISPQIYIKNLRPGENNFGRLERAKFSTNPTVWINSEKNSLTGIRDYLVIGFCFKNILKVGWLAAP